MIKIIWNKIWWRGYITESCTNSLLKIALNFPLFYLFIVTKMSQKKCLPSFWQKKILVWPLLGKLCLCLGKAKCVCCALIHWGIMSDRYWNLNFYSLKHGEYPSILTCSVTSKMRWMLQGFWCPGRLYCHKSLLQCLPKVQCSWKWTPVKWLIHVVPYLSLHLWG